MLYEWRDEPYIRPVYQGGEATSCAKLASRFARDRVMGARALGLLARDCRQRGEAREANRLARILVDHLKHERDRVVRTAILALALRNAGATTAAVKEALHQHLATSEHAVSAAHTLCALRVEGSWEAVKQAYALTPALTVRYELTEALWLLGDMRAKGLFKELIAQLRASPIRQIHHMPKEVCLTNLQSRLVTLRSCQDLPGSATMRTVGSPAGTSKRVIVQETGTGPMILIFPGRSAAPDDATLGIRETALELARRMDASVALFSWQGMDQARAWLASQATLRRSTREPVRVGLVGHSWGGQAASALARELVAQQGLQVDQIFSLITIDAIQQGYGKAGLKIAAQFGSGEGIFGHRTGWSAFKNAPAPDGERLLRHVNFFQTDSPYLHGNRIATATENHEVWFDGGSELGHGNLDNYLIDVVVEEVRRSARAGTAAPQDAL